MNAAMRIREIVNGRGVTYTFISEKTGIPIDTISRIFLNKRKLMADEMLKICSATGIDLHDLNQLNDQQAANQ